MKKLFILILCAAFLFTLAQTTKVQATTIDFDELAVNTSYASLVYDDVTFTNNMGNLNTYYAPGAPLSGISIIGPNTHQTGEWNVATFDSDVSVNYVSVDIGDFDQDYDTIEMYAYNSANVLLGSDTDLVPDYLYGGLTLEIATSEAIAYVYFNETGLNNQATGYPGSAYFDNFTYTCASVPEPCSMILLGSLLIGFLGLSKKEF